jgi:hypothetical protein
MITVINDVMKFLGDVLKFFNDNLGFITLVVGLFALYLYKKGKRDYKRNAALLILQEIRYTEQRVRNYKTYGSYSFTEKLLPTNSWHANINLFVKDLQETDIDRISKFYSSAAYLDEVISIASNSEIESILKPPTPSISVGQTQIASSKLSPSAKEYIEKISESVEYIYNTPTINKLRAIAEKKWYQPSHF